MSFSLSLSLSWQASWVYYRSEKFSPYWTPTIRQSPPRRLPPHRPPTPPPCRPGPRPRRGLPCHMCEREISLKIGQNRTFTVLQRRLWMLRFLCLCLFLSLPTCWSCQLSPSFWSIVGKVTCVYDRSAVLWWLWNQKSLSDWATQWQAKKSNQSLKCI